MTFYTDDQIAGFARAQNCSVDDFKQRWIIMRDGAYFVHGANGYLPPIKTMTDLGVSLPRDLASVPPSSRSKAGIDWDIPHGNGTRPKSTDAILREHATVARKLIASMAIEQSRYDETTQTFYERVCPLRRLTPEFDPQVDKWMRLLGGKDSETFLDWVATITNLSRVTCAIYLHAGKDFGKTMLACGLARLWGSMPTELESAMSDFNSAILNCPLIFADEELPKGIRSGFLRRFVGTPNRPLKRKGLPEADLLGAIRLIIAANNDNLLEFDDESFSPDDINAVAARILYIKCDPKTAEYLKEIGGYKGTRDWVEGDKIAKHALWLRDNRSLKEGSRFLVEGEKDMIHRRLATSGSIRGMVVEWICRAIVTEWHEQNPGIRFGGGKLFVNASFVKQTWERVTGDPRAPSLQKIGRAFKPLSIDEKRFKLGTRRADFYEIDVRHIYDSCSSLQVATVEEMEKRINRPVIVDKDDDEGGNGNSSPVNSHSNGANGHTNGHANGALLQAIPFSDITDSNVRSLFDYLK